MKVDMCLEGLAWALCFMEVPLWVDCSVLELWYVGNLSGGCNVLLAVCGSMRGW